MLAYYIIHRGAKVIGYTTMISEADIICDLYRDLFWVFSKTKPPKEIKEITIADEMI